MEKHYQLLERKNWPKKFDLVSSWRDQLVNNILLVEKTNKYV